MIAIIDYGVGNLFSLKSSFAAIGAEAVVTDDKEVIARADKIILPGVGAFGDAAEKLKKSGLADVIPKELKIPHIGWNALHFGQKKHSLFRYLEEGDHVYFVHSFYGANCAESVIATAEYGAELTAAVASGNVYGCQFHPEKSGNVGLNILRAFCEKEA